MTLFGLLAACAPDGTRDLHEVVLASEDGVERYRYAYGSSDLLPLPGGQDLALGPRVGEAATETPFAVAGARTVADGEPFVRDRYGANVALPLRVSRIPLTTDLRLVLQEPVDRSWYFDGDRWFELPRELTAPRTVDVVPRPAATPFRGAASLTPAEADALAGGLASDGEAKVVSWRRPQEASEPEDVAAFADDEADDRPAWAPHPPDGVDAYRHSLFYVQRGVQVDASAYRPPERESIHEVVASGSQGATPERDRFVLLRSESDLRTFWNQVHAGGFADAPELPEARFGRETLLGVRLAQRPTGGYGIDVSRVTREDDELFVDLRLTEPAEDAIVTQALTAPWMLIRVLGSDATVAWFRDPEAGTLFAVARTD